MYEKHILRVLRDSVAIKYLEWLEAIVQHAAFLFI